MQFFPRRRSQGRPVHPDVLTPAEWRVLEQVRAGRTNQEIAVKLGVTHNTVKSHVSSMLAKLNVEHRHELAVWQGAPAEASRAVLGRMHLVGPLGWLGTRVATWTGRIAVGAGTMAIGAAFFFAMQSVNESGSLLGARRSATPPATPIEAPASIPQSTFVAATSPDVVRSFHTATLLNADTVLVAGGCCVGASGLVAGAERYDPVTDSWSPAGELALPRQTHTATRLPDGRVVLIGGVGVGDPSVDSNPPLAEIEIYDPEQAEFSLAGTLITPRLAHDAVLMPDGRVLVIGGTGRGDPPRDIEVFDPATGETTRWLAELPSAFDMPQAFPLGDGVVLVVGGGSAALLDPATETLDLLPPPEGLDAWPTNAVPLADGRVLFAGGCCDQNDALTHAALLDPLSRASYRLSEMNTGRVSQTMTLLDDGRALIVGGLANAGHGFGEALASAELFEPTTATFTALPPMSQPRTNHTVTLLRDGSALLVGPNSQPGPGTVRFIP